MPARWAASPACEAALPRLRELGITAIELMPIDDFPGARNWGYDGVLPYAPDTAYGPPEALKSLVDAAHGLGLMVFLDVVYNHFGPDGAYLHAYAKRFFDEGIHTPWGAAIDFRQAPVRDFFEDNALFWLERIPLRRAALRRRACHRRGGLAGRAGRPHPRARSRIATSIWCWRTSATAPATCSPLGGFDAQWNDDGHNILHAAADRRARRLLRGLRR